MRKDIYNGWYDFGYMRYRYDGDYIEVEVPVKSYDYEEEETCSNS